MVILESLACQTPVMSTNVGGIKELIADNITCIVNDQRDPAEFAAIAQTLLNSRNKNTPETRFSSVKASVIVNEILSK